MLAATVGVRQVSGQRIDLMIGLGRPERSKGVTRCRCYSETTVVRVRVGC